MPYWGNVGFSENDDISMREEWKQRQLGQWLCPPNKPACRVVGDTTVTFASCRWTATTLAADGA